MGSDNRNHNRRRERVNAKNFDIEQQMLGMSVDYRYRKPSKEKSSTPEKLNPGTPGTPETQEPSQHCIAGNKVFRFRPLCRGHRKKVDICKRLVVGEMEKNSKRKKKKKKKKK